MERTDRAADASAPPTARRACPACGGTDLRAWIAEATDRQHGSVPGSFRYDRCRRCGSALLADPVEDLASLYPSSYAPHGSGRPADAPPATRLSEIARALGPLAWRAASISGRVPDPLPAARAWALVPAFEGERFLDHGCGTSAPLEEAAAHGWIPIGTDASPGVVAAVREAGFEAHLADEVDAAIAPGSLGAVRLNHVLEHVAEPASLLVRLRKLLRTGGRLHAALPNVDGPSARLFGSAWWGLDCPRHLFLPTPRAAAAMARRAGFTEVRVLHERLTKDLARSYGYRLAERGSIDTEAAMSMQHDQDLARLLRPLAVAAAVAGRGDRYHLFARA